ncbi:hypothetical protein RJ641_027079 [Dillenia turbinata]|uniref:NAA35-like TPR repeats domain-containing protein n=1 Tax=Dillenia turbinata TaxID=194707 RepID=A0AAN8ZLC0_9MAGN
MVYWYIYVIMIKLAEKTHLRMVERNEIAASSIEQQFNIDRSQLRLKVDLIRRSLLKGKARRSGILQKTSQKVYHISPSILWLYCHICLSEGLTMMLAALRNECNIFQIISPFNSEHERFIQHFELLQKAFIPEHTLSSYNYFKEAQRITMELRGSFPHDEERLAELRQIELAAEHNGIALNVVCQVGAVDPTLKVTFEFSHHPYFAIAVVKRS